ncbi:DUF5343 domain-containing protein [Gryllotalpicola daejeonensis]|uniref:DUF5343 domain-containing protein n=1 Tax=Gryllotalpicola daejeonensis TaxID=993087 RepID=A0ABP7ZMK4_9MICO
MANELPLTTSANSITRFLTHIQAAGVPTKVDRTYLKSVGFKSGQDNYIIPILKHIGFLSASGTPETRWRSYRDKKQAPKVLAEGIRQAYADLFAVYPDAYRKDEEAIRNWVRSQTGYDEVKVGHAVKTFRTLCSAADFGSPSEASVSQSEPRLETTATHSGALGALSVPTPTAPSVSISIELHLPASADADTYDKFFAAMKKHLFPDASA